MQSLDTSPDQSSIRSQTVTSVVPALSQLTFSSSLPVPPMARLPAAAQSSPRKMSMSPVLLLKKTSMLSVAPAATQNSYQSGSDFEQNRLL